MSVNKIFRTLGQFCVLGVIVAGPWRNGGSEPVILQFFLYLLAAGTIFTLAALWTTPRRERQKFVYFPTILVSIPLLLGMALCVFQCVPLSDDLLLKTSPNIVKLRNTLLSPDLKTPLSQLSAMDSDAKLKEELAKTGAVELQRDFLNQTIPYSDSSSFDLERAMIVDQAVENEFLSKNNEKELPTWGNRISVYPLATRSGIPLFGAGLLLFLIVSTLFNTKESRLVFFKTVGIAGFFYALLCIATRANHDGVASGFLKHVWDYLYLGPYGTYVNKNACGGYLVLTLAACVFVSAREFLRAASDVNRERRERERDQKEAKQEKVYEIKSEAAWKRILGDLFDLFNRRLVFWLVITSVVFAAVFASLSRGASVAATAAFAIACLLLVGKKEVRRYWYVLAVTLGIAVAVVVATSMYEQIDSRMSTLVDEDGLGQTALRTDSRWENWRSALKTSQDYRWFGSGLGTYSIANSHNDTSLRNDFLFYYAENVFVQTLLEMGIIGLALLVITYVLLFIMLSRYLYKRHSFEAYALSVASVTLIVGQLFAAAADFGIYLPANLFLFAALCSVPLGRQNHKLWEDLNLALADKKRALSAARKIEKISRIERVGLCIFSLLLLGSLAGCHWLISENSDSVQRARLINEADSVYANLTHMSSDSLNGLVEEFEKFVAVRDDSYEMRDKLSQLWIQKFRLNMLANLKNAQPERNENELWGETRVEVLLEPLVEYQRIGFTVPVVSIRGRDDVLEYLRHATNEYLIARRLCPLYVRINRRLMATLPLTADLSFSDERLLMELYSRRAVSFLPYDSKEAFRNGCYFATFKLPELQRKFLRRSLELSYRNIEQILVSLVISEPVTNIAQAYDDVLPNNVATAGKAVQASKEWDKTSEYYKILLDKVENIFTSIPEEDRKADYYSNFAVYHNYIGRQDLADDDLVKALELDPYNPAYCLRRARLLTKHTKLLDKDKECVDFLREVLPRMRGFYKWECQRLLKIAEENLRNTDARREAQERIRREREVDERVRENAKAKQHEGELSPDELSETQTDGADEAEESETEPFDVEKFFHEEDFDD